MDQIQYVVDAMVITVGIAYALFIVFVSNWDERTQEEQEGKTNP